MGEGINWGRGGRAAGEGEQCDPSCQQRSLRDVWVLLVPGDLLAGVSVVWWKECVVPER